MRQFFLVVKKNKIKWSGGVSGMLNLQVQV